MKIGISALLDSLDISFDAQKIGFFLAGLMVAIIGAVIFTLIGNMYIQNIPLYVFFAILASLWASFAIYFTRGGVTRMVYNELSGAGKLSFKDAFAFAKKNAGALMLSPLAILLVVIGVVIFELLLTLVLRFVPGIGNIAIALLAIPLVAVNAPLIIALNFLEGLPIAIVAVDESDIKGTVAKTYNIVKNEPLRFLSLISITCILYCIAALALILLGAASILLSAGVSWPLLIDLYTAATTGMGMTLSLGIALTISIMSMMVLLAIAFSYLNVVFSGLYAIVYSQLKEQM